MPNKAAEPSITGGLYRCPGSIRCPAHGSEPYFSLCRSWACSVQRYNPPVIDGSPPSAFAVEICQPQGCSAALKLEGELLTKLKKGNKATLTVYDPRLQPLAIPVSLSGFTKGVSKIK